MSFNCNYCSLVAMIFANVCAIYVTIHFAHVLPIYSAAKLVGRDTLSGPLCTVVVGDRIACH